MTIAALATEERAVVVEVLCVGEVLMDFVPVDGDGAYAPRPGGAPANVAASLASLGRKVALVSAVGEDWLGDELLRTLEAVGVDITHVQRDPQRSSGAAIVAPDGASGPGFVIYRGGTADSSFALTDVAADAVRRATIVHLSSLLTASHIGETAYRQLLFVLDRSAAKVSYDVNLREGAWSDQEAMRMSAMRMIGSADIVKVTEDELRGLDLTVTMETAGEKLWLITDGGVGARLVSSDFSVAQPVIPAPVVDTTGAGDASLATLLDEVLASEGYGRWSANDASRVLQRVIGVGSAVVQQSGAMCDLSEFRRR